MQIMQVTERKFEQENQNILKTEFSLAKAYNKDNNKNLSNYSNIEVFCYLNMSCHLWSSEISHNIAIAWIIRETKQLRKWKTT